MADEAVYAIASGKGGVGKTTTTVNLGTALAGAGHSVAVVDADLGMANLAGFVSLSPDSTTLHEVLAGEASVEEATYELTDNIAAVPSGDDLRSYANVDATELGDVVERLRDEFEYVLLDVGAGVSHETVLPLGLADHVVLVSTPDPAAVRDAEKTLDLTHRADGDVLGLVLTRTRDDRDIDFEAVASKVGVPLLGSVPEDDAVHEAIYSGTPVVVDAPESPAGVAYRRIAERIVGRGDGASADAAGATETADTAVAGESASAEDAASTAEVSSAIDGVDGSGGGTGNETADADGPDSAAASETGASAERDGTPGSDGTAESESPADSEGTAESKGPGESDGDADGETTASADPGEESTAASPDAAEDPSDDAAVTESTEEAPVDDGATAGDGDAESAAADADADTGPAAVDGDADSDAEAGVTIPDAEADVGSGDDSDGVTFAEGDEESEGVDEEAIPFSDRQSPEPGGDGDTDGDDDDEDEDDGFFGRLLG